jgi:nucleotide-binding universal stress UspA family protein
MRIPAASVSSMGSAAKVAPASLPVSLGPPVAPAPHVPLDWAPFRLWLAVRDHRPRPVRFPGEARRIMMGADFSQASDAAMGVVFGIAATTGTVVDLVHVFDGFTEAFIFGDRPLLDHVDTVLARVGQALRARTSAAAADGVRCVSTSLVGAPGIELTQHARRTGADLLVLGLGTEARGPLGRAWSADAAIQAVRTGIWHQRPLVTSACF